MTDGYGYGSSSNPYQPPSFATQGQWAPMPGPSSVSPALVESLRRTRPWVMFLAILGTIWMGFAVLGGIGMVAGASAMGGEEAMGVGFVYLVMFGIYILPIVMMYRYAGAIQRLVSGGGQAELEQAVDAQRLIWTVLGIMVLLAFVLGVLFVFAIGAFFANSGPGAFKF
jgi:hypothetical protein